MRRFKMSGKTYAVKIKRFDGPQEETLQYFGESLQTLADRLLADVDPDDFLGMQLSLEGM